MARHVSQTPHPNERSEEALELLGRRLRTPGPPPRLAEHVAAIREMRLGRHGTLTHATVPNTRARRDFYRGKEI